MEKVDFTVKCAQCNCYYDNWIGSTPCCGSIAYRVEDDGSVSDDVLLFSTAGVATIKIPKK